MDNQVSLLFAGDVFIEQNLTKLFDTGFLEIVQKSNVFCCNLEAPIYYDGQQPAKEYGIKLSQPKCTVDLLKSEGVNLFALANNHIMNYGTGGLRYTIDCIGNQKIGAGFSEQEACKAFIYEKNGVSVGIINAAERQYGTLEQYGGVGYAWIFSAAIQKEIQRIRADCDYVVFICHGGVENTDVPLPEWRSVYRHLIDQGVDVVIGHHPHVVQGWETYEKGIIFYSLGNFIWKPICSRDPNVISIVVSLTMSKTSLEYTVHPVEFRDGLVRLADKEKYKDYLQEICNVLSDDSKYYRKVDNLCEREYKRYANLTHELIGLRPTTRLRNRLLNFFTVLFGKDKVDERFLYLWVGNESMRWVIVRAIYNRQLWKE